MSDPKIYTVGWICAIVTEYVAAQAFLDQRHEEADYVSVNDNNVYTLGSIGRHNVVIAVLPDGEYGTASAAGVARDMLHSFPNIRIGLMVGIAGGVPSPKHDIRLGDVVVSAPHRETGGIFQYDFGKSIQNQSFLVTRYLNQPPALLRAAVAGLKTQYEGDGHQIKEKIDEILASRKRLIRKYKRPSPETDRLYKPSVLHPQDNDGFCASVCGEDTLSLVSRGERDGDEEDDPTIHYGLIASANQLMKDAVLRDKLAKEKDVLCFEMEAAGLMNHFPCLVIRGICDYSDTHKNKEWQGYAAMTAAAYAKDLLCRITPNKIEAEQKLVDNKLQVLTQDVTNIGVQRRHDRIHLWLSPPDPSTNYDEALQQRQDGTGQWLLEHTKFKRWITQQNSFLWLHGIPGCGKTILTSTVVEHIEKSVCAPVLLYFYFDFNNTSKQTLESLVTSLISQLYNKSDIAQEHIGAMFSSHLEGHRRPTCKSLCDAFTQMVKQIADIWIVIDALDECSTRTGPATVGLLSWINALLDGRPNNVHLMVTSRPEQDISEGLDSLVLSHEGAIPIQDDLIKEDIDSYIRVKVRKDVGLKRWHRYRDIQDEIEVILVEKARGMFRWVTCQMDALELCLDYHSLRSALASLPKTLDETYSRILNSIPPEHKENALRILQLLTYSERPLSRDEVVDAIAVNIEESPYFSPKYRMPDPREISRYCSSLVAVVTKTARTLDGTTERIELQLAHLSVQEYLTSDRVVSQFAKGMQQTTARASIAKIYLAYLLHFDMGLSTEEIATSFPLARLSATKWMNNVGGVRNEDSVLASRLKKFFCCSGVAYSICFSIYRPDEPWLSRSALRQTGPPPALYYAAFGNLVEVVSSLLAHGVDVNAKGGLYGNALQAASAEGHRKIVKLLLDKGADIHASGGVFGTALAAASFVGHKETVQLLLHNGADVHQEFDDYEGEFDEPEPEDFIQLVLDRCLDKGIQDVESVFGLEGDEADELLVMKLFGMDKLGDGFNNATEAAITGNKMDVLEVLLEHGVDVHRLGGDYDSLLGIAAYRGTIDILELLLSRGADPYRKLKMYGNALGAAAAGGSRHIVELLLDRGVEMNVEGELFCSAVGAAAYKGDVSIIDLLLSKGADIQARGGRYGSALGAAAFAGSVEAVELLLRKGADVMAVNRNGRTSLYLASSRGNDDAVRLLLERGMDPNVLDDDNATPLYAAAREGHIETVRLLLDNQASLFAATKEGWTPLHAASSNGFVDIVKVLIDREAGVDFNGQQ